MDRKIILAMHVSLDGFVAGVGRDLDWIHVDDEVFDLIGKMTDEADTALYGRVTYDLMEGHWPTAYKKPDASGHDIKHSEWYNGATKVVISKTMKDSDDPKTKIIREEIPGRIAALKQDDGKNIMLFGSPSTSNFLMQHELIDEFWLFVYPLLLGSGIPLFEQGGERTNLKLADNKTFSSGVAGLHYSRI